MFLEKTQEILAKHLNKPFEASKSPDDPYERDLDNFQNTVSKGNDSPTKNEAKLFRTK